MIHGSIHERSLQVPVSNGEPWDGIFQWLLETAPDVELGRYELFGSHITATVMQYNTVPRAEARIESHQEFIDVQYTLEGEEFIDWHSRSTLIPDGPFELDVQFWRPPAFPGTTLLQAAGRFAVFFPADAHRPRIQVDQSGTIRKVVVKLACSHFKALSAGR